MVNKEPKDKRTKAWKEWKENFDKENTIGLGDAIEKVTKATGIKKVVEAVTNDCGCEERKAKANKVRIKWTNTRCFTEEQYNYWTEFRKEKGDLNQEQIKKLREIMIQLFSVDIGKPSCCVDQYINEVNKVYETY
jgi:hypothetical protein